MSTQLLTELPMIQKTGMDYESVIQEIKNIINENPNWSDNWTEFRDSEAGTMLIDLFAWITDNMSTRQDLLYNEMFIGTAQSDLNKIRHLKQIGYVPRMAHSAKVPLKITFTKVIDGEVDITPKKSGDLSSRVAQIASFTSRDINGREIPWEIIKIEKNKPDYLGEIRLNADGIEYHKDSSGEDLYALQGRTIYEEFTVTSSDGNFFPLKEKNIASDSIQVYIKGSADRLTEVKSFISTEALDINNPKPYVVEMNEDRSYRIRFANKNISKEERLIPAGTVISVFYRVCDGTLGNIKPGFINKNTEYTSYNNTGADNITYSANIYNELPAVGGTDAESLDDAVLNGPLSLVTMNRAVTPDDYDIILNSNTNIYKSKTYTASNQPDKFKEYYGRYINPQESFIFAMINKNHEGVPTEKYNYFPWLTTIKEPRINERYIFDNGDFNDEVSIRQTLYNAQIMETGNPTPVKFNNATIINIGNKFNNTLYTDKESKIENEFLKLKITTEPTKESYFDDIIFNLFSDDVKKDTTYLSMNQNYISMDDHARFLTEDSYDMDEPIDVIDSRYLTFIVDNKFKVAKIDFWSMFDSSKMPKHAYLKWDNDIVDQHENHLNDESKDAAKYRLGIKQIINNSINNAIENGGNFEYKNMTSEQKIGLNFESSDDIVPIMTDLSNFKFSLNINGIDYLFNMKKPQYEKDWGKISSFVRFLNDCFSTGNNVKKWINNSEEDLGIDELKGYKAKDITVKEDKTSFEFSSGSSDIFKYDFCICNANKDLTDPTLKDIKYIKEGKEHILKNVIDIQDPIAEIQTSDGDTKVTYPGLFNKLKSLGSSQGRRDNENIPLPTQAADYRMLADIKYIKDYDPEEKNKEGRLRIMSPTMGEESSLYFENNGIGEETDFGKNSLKITYNNGGGRYSVKVFGEKKAYMLKRDALSIETIQDDQIIPSNIIVSQGNVIFENSCMFIKPDFKQLFSSYKLVETNQILLGSSYENYFYSGNEIIDNNLKKDNNVVGVLGQSMYYKELENGEKVYLIDEDKSRLNVKFTSVPQATNSLFAIPINKSDEINAVASDVVSFYSNDINENISYANLIFKIDKEIEIDVNTSNVNTAKGLVNEIKKRIDEMYENKEDVNKIRNNFYSLFNVSYSNNKQLVIKSLSNSDGKISLLRDTSKSEDENRKFFKALLGLNDENKDFYDLYPKENFSSEIIIDSTKDTSLQPGQYYYCPTPTNEKVINLEYRKLVKGKDNIVTSRPADYKIDIKENFDPVTSRSTYQFFLTKTANSKFPDNYFYMHFVNDKSYDYIGNNKIRETDESVLQDYMYKYKVSGTDITFIQPYFKTYDIEAIVKYSSNFNELEVRTDITNAINNLCGLDNAQIAGSMSRAKIFKAIMNCNGVIDCKINFFGLNVKDPSGDSEELISDFYEIMLLHETTKSGKGLKLILEAV